MIRTVLVEDEFQNLERLENLLHLHCPDVEIAGRAGSVKDAYGIIREVRPELVFLDIQLNDGNGFGLLKLFEEIDFKLIFVTAYEKFAVKAFRFSALDYLLKPVDPEELTDAVNKARESIDPQLKSLVQQASSNFSGRAFDKIVLRDFDKIHLVEVADILYCEADGNYTRFHLSGTKPILVSRYMKEYEEILRDSGFLRIHRSYMINLKHFRQYEKAEGGKVILSNGAEIPVGAGKREELYEYLRKFLG
jgi:two-component system LytT family response regulator